MRDAHTLTLVRKLAFDPLQLASYTPDIARARILIAPDGHTVYCAYQGFSRNTFLPAATYLARWSLPSGRLLSTRRIGGAAVLAVGLTDAGARVAVVDARTVSVFDARSLRRLSSVAITPTLAAPSDAAISPDGHTVAIGSQAGAVSFIDVASGRRAPRGRPEHRFGGQHRLLARRSRGRERRKQHSDHLESTIRHAQRGPDRPGRTGARGRVQPRRTDPLHIIGRGPCARMGPDRRAALRTALRAQRAIALLRPGRAARAAAGPLAGRHDLRHPPRHLHRRTVLSPDPATTGIVHRQTQGRRHHRARVVTHRTRTRCRRFLRSRPALAHGRHAPARAFAERPAAGPRAARSDPSRCILSRRPTHRRERHPQDAVAGLLGVLAQQRSSLITGDLAREQRQTERSATRSRNGHRALRSARVLS